jgi:hypothetical protein
MNAMKSGMRAPAKDKNSVKRATTAKNPCPRGRDPKELVEAAMLTAVKFVKNRSSGTTFK